MTHYLLNAFSFNMVAASSATIHMEEISAARAAEWLLPPSEYWEWLDTRSIDPWVVQAVGHADTAALFGKVLDIDGIQAARVSVTLNVGDTALVGQYSGPRLPEGATSLPEGASIRWLLVTVSRPALEGQVD